MGTLSVRMPESLHAHIRQLAKEEGASINQFIITAVAEKLSALETERLLKLRAQQGDVAQFKQLLAQVPDRPALPEDNLSHE